MHKHSRNTVASRGFSNSKGYENAARRIAREDATPAPSPIQNRVLAQQAAARRREQEVVPEALQEIAASVQP